MQLSNEPAEKLADVLIESSKGAFELVGFVSGGSEAVEGALKLARQYYHETNEPKRSKFIARELSYHGNTISTLALAYHPARRAPYAPILDEKTFHHVSPAYAKRYQKADETEAEYVERLRQELEAKFLKLGPETVIGFVCESVVGATTGVVAAPEGYLKAMKSVCEKYGALFILDEVMCGMGRMGTLHAWEGLGGVAPDIQAVAKGLGGGYASIGAVFMNKRVAEGVQGMWKHGHTYQAHPISCAASLAVQEVIVSENLLENANKQGEYLSKLLNERLRGPNSIAAPYTFDIRGKGSFWGIEFNFTDKSVPKVDMKGKQFAMAVQARCMERGVVVMGFSGSLPDGTGDHLCLAPSYMVTSTEIEAVVERVVSAVEDVLREHLA